MKRGSTRNGGLEVKTTFRNTKHIKPSMATVWESPLLGKKYRGCLQEHRLWRWHLNDNITLFLKRGNTARYWKETQNMHWTHDSRKVRHGIVLHTVYFHLQLGIVFYHHWFNGVRWHYSLGNVNRYLLSSESEWIN